MSNWNQVKDGGKGSGMRKGFNKEAFDKGYANIFNKPCSECGGEKGVHTEECSRNWRAQRNK